MASNEKFTAQQVIDALTATRGMKTLAARKLGCAYNTIQRYIDNYPTVAAALQEAHESAGDAVELKLYDKAMSGDTTALIFLAKTKFKERGYIERQEHTGKDGEALKIEWIDPLTDDDDIGIGADELTDPDETA